MLKGSLSLRVLDERVDVAERVDQKVDFFSVGEGLCQVSRCAMESWAMKPYRHINAAVVDFYSQLISSGISERYSAVPHLIARTETYRSSYTPSA